MGEIRVRKVETPAKIERSALNRLKELRLTRRVSFMKKERVPCPLRGEEISPIYCLLCDHYRRRVKGVIHCDIAD